MSPDSDSCSARVGSGVCGGGSGWLSSTGWGSTTGSAAGSAVSTSGVSYGVSRACSSSGSAALPWRLRAGLTGSDPSVSGGLRRSSTSRAWPSRCGRACTGVPVTTSTPNAATRTSSGTATTEVRNRSTRIAEVK